MVPMRAASAGCAAPTEVVATLARHRPVHTDRALLALTAAVPVEVAYITR